uniref:Uncharacterized protein n=1 Tax=Dunaliella tertiolecta TaxID=3047 RepID=A0A7S3VRJ7_DUNTE|mmetsp:Transcript_25774/g.69914  ORF Transcript_25774/g.69914 Transcript_25774/m.69914 type:complete len:118 (+) Transcript_25774:514-867(+)
MHCFTAGKANRVQQPEASSGTQTWRSTITIPAVSYTRQFIVAAFTTSNRHACIITMVQAQAHAHQQDSLLQCSKYCTQPWATSPFDQRATHSALCQGEGQPWERLVPGFFMKILGSD